MNIEFKSFTSAVPFIGNYYGEKLDNTIYCFVYINDMLYISYKILDGVSTFDVRDTKHKFIQEIIACGQLDDIFATERNITRLIHEDKEAVEKWYRDGYHRRKCTGKLDDTYAEFVKAPLKEWSEHEKIKVSKKLRQV